MAMEVIIEVLLAHPHSMAPAVKRWDEASLQNSRAQTKFSPPKNNVVWEPPWKSKPSNHSDNTLEPFSYSVWVMLTWLAAAFHPRRE